MLGFSLTKLLFFALIIGGIWFVFFRPKKAVDSKPKSGGRFRASSPSDAKSEEGIEDLQKCPACGTYVVLRSGTTCGRPACPGS